MSGVSIEERPSPCPGGIDNRHTVTECKRHESQSVKYTRIHSRIFQRIVYRVNHTIAEVTRDTNNMRRPGRGLPIRGAFGGDISLDSASVLSYDASSMVSEDLSFGHSVI